MSRHTLTAHVALTSAATLILAFAVSAPAMAGCHSTMVTEFHADDSDVDVRARDCAYWGAYGQGYGHQLSGAVAGNGTQVVTGSLGYGTRTDINVRGYDNLVATETRSGGLASVFSRGDGNEIVGRSAYGSVTDMRIYGSGNRIRSSAQ